MPVRITLRDFRCFRRERPAVIELREGFSAFIGPNNAGKSALLKSFFELRPLYQCLTNIPGYWGINLDQSHSFVYPAPITDPNEIVNERGDPELTVEIELLNVESGGSGTTINRVRLLNENSNWRLEAFPYRDSTPIGSRYGKPLTGGNATLVGAGGQEFNLHPIHTAAKSIVNTLYIGAFRNAINEGGADYFDLRVGTGFIDLWHAWKTGGMKSQNRETSLVTRDIARLLGAKSLEINAAKELKTLQIQLDDGHFKLSELGSGLAELVVVLANAAIKRPEFILIDEPETHLHPRLQLDFLTTLASYARTGVLFSTHALGLARALGDRTYAVQRDQEGSSIRPLAQTTNYAEFLGSLGIAALQDIGYDTILLVEGVTDVRVFQQFLKQMQLDGRVVILPLGGSQMINRKIQRELAEVTRLTPNVYAVIDSEKRSKDEKPPKDRREFLEACADVKIKAMATEYRAIENYFTDRAIKSVKGKKYDALGPFDLPEDSNFWGKTNNWLIAREMTLDELRQTDIGTFLEGIKN